MSATAPAPILTLDQLTFQYPRTPRAALEQLSWTQPSGEFLGLTGPNGGGKSTLLKLLLGFLKPTAGSIRVAGRDPTTLGRDRRTLGYVPQHIAMHPYYPASVREVVRMGVAATRPLWSLSRLPRVDRDHADQCVVKVGLGDLLHKSVRALSGGQQQRVAIARALAGRPRLLLLDEPTSSLDTDAKAQLFALLDRLRDEDHLTVIMVSHDLRALIHHADTILCIRRQLLWHGHRPDFDEPTLQNLIESPTA